MLWQLRAGIFEESPSGWEGAPAEPSSPGSLENHPGHPGTAQGPSLLLGGVGTRQPQPLEPHRSLPHQCHPSGPAFWSCHPQTSLLQVWGHTRPWGRGVPGLPLCRGLGVSNAIPKSPRAVRNLSCPARTECRGTLGQCRVARRCLGSDLGVKPQVSNN